MENFKLKKKKEKELIFEVKSCLNGLNSRIRWQKKESLNLKTNQ